MITTVQIYTYKGFNIEIDFDSEHEPDGIFFGRIKNNAGIITERSHTSF